MIFVWTILISQCCAIVGAADGFPDCGLYRGTYLIRPTNRLLPPVFSDFHFFYKRSKKKSTTSSSCHCCLSDSPTLNSLLCNSHSDATRHSVKIRSLKIHTLIVIVRCRQILRLPIRSVLSRTRLPQKFSDPYLILQVGVKKA